MLSFTIQDHLPRDGTARSGRDLPTSVIIQENDPTRLPIDQPDGGDFSDMAPSSELTLVCVKLTNPNSPAYVTGGDGVVRVLVYLGGGGADLFLGGGLEHRNKRTERMLA